MLLGYARVSTSDGRQVTDRQEDALREAGCDRVFIDHTSGAKADRPQLNALWNAAREGDTIVVQALDRLGRDTRQLLAWADELRVAGIHLRILQLGVDTATPAGKLVFTLISALAEHERQLLRERVKDGLAAARSRGRVGGRPASLSDAQKREAMRLRQEGRPAGEVAELFGCSTRTIRRLTAATVTEPDVVGRDTSASL
jgi:DNA invertase Pin-like site-specific DNA recombinase